MIIFILAITIFNLLQAKAVTPPSAGNGSSGNPYQVASLENLYWIEGNIQKEFTLHQNFPNTIIPSKKTKFGLPKNDIVELLGYDILGQEVANLINKEMLAGYHLIEFGNNRLASGIYIYRLTIDGKKECFSSVKKMIYLK